MPRHPIQVGSAELADVTRLRLQLLTPASVGYRRSYRSITSRMTSGKYSAYPFLLAGGAVAAGTGALAGGQV